MDDWQPGDLALCVGSHPKYPRQVQPGALLRVEYVWHGSCDEANPAHVDTALDFVRIPRMDGDICYWQGNFRKIRPHTRDAEDEETIRLLTGAPVREPVQ